MVIKGVVNGILLVDKPSGPTSFDIVRKVRRAFQLKKVGHAGTLDPLASGLLVVCLGQGTKLVPYLMDSEKCYLARVRLGAQTNTDDSMGEVIKEAPVPNLDISMVANVISNFIGEIWQVPPIYSALKKDGEALYKKARRGEKVEVKPRVVFIREIKIIELACNEIELEVRCGKGTYIRSLARDLGIALGTHAHLCSLRRTYSSGFSVHGALTLEQLETPNPDERDSLMKRLIWGGDALTGYPSIKLDKAEELLVNNGRSVQIDQYRVSHLDENDLLVLLGDKNRLAAIGRLCSDGVVKMERVFSL